VLGTAVLIQSAIRLAASLDEAPVIWIGALFAAAAGMFLLAGLLTPLAASFAGVFVALSRILIAPPPKPDLFASTSNAVLVVSLAVAVAILGPGAFSLDARFFGLREIIIPTSRSAASHDRGSAE
jgi:uncharacterized membrane protein YphA (DoxX/SURF4 family)